MRLNNLIQAKILVTQADNGGAGAGLRLPPRRVVEHTEAQDQKKSVLLFHVAS